MRRAWIVVFLALTFGALGMELVAGLDSSPDTVPWTELISTYIPQPVTFAAIGALAVWLPAHFARHYGSKEGQMGKYRKSFVAAAVAGLTALGTALADDRVTNLEWVAIGSAVVAALGVVWAVPNATAARPAASDEDAAIRRSFR